MPTKPSHQEKSKPSHGRLLGMAAYHWEWLFIMPYSSGKDKSATTVLSTSDQRPATSNQKTAAMQTGCLY
eukprot:1157342-Pelagomonas_calceolata.AAC.6